MAFAKTGKAALVKPGINADEWCGIRQAAMGDGGAKVASEMRAAKVTLDKVDPGKFLLSHCTIIASVDTDSVPGSSLGKQMVNGFQIDRKYPDYYIKPNTSKFVNNNNDAWERKLLLACYKTFIGGENYVEHIQIPEMSKGKILDAAARNIGDSVYVDILVATDRKHKPLVSAITSGQLGTLSMGCSVNFTICSKCGNVAEDETQLCSDIRYFKGSEFIDEMGVTRKIAELCGHIDAEPGSVGFIEGSWVANPAFKGAVIRNILTHEEAAALSGNPAFVAALSSDPRVAPIGAMQRAARSLLGQDDFQFEEEPADQGQEQVVDQGEDQGGQEQAVPDQGGESQESGGGQEQGDPMDSLVDELTTNVKDKVKQNVREEINEGDAAEVRQVLDENSSNESLIKSALQHEEWQRIAQLVKAKVGSKGSAKLLLGLIFHKKGGWEAVRAAKQFTGVDILAVSRVLDMMTKRASIAGEARVYRTVVAVGGTAPYEDVTTYLTACRRVLGRTLTGTETALVLEKGRLFSLGL